MERSESLFTRGFVGVADEFAIALLRWLCGLRRMSRSIRVLSWSWMERWMEALVPSPRTTPYGAHAIELYPRVACNRTRTENGLVAIDV